MRLLKMECSVGAQLALLGVSAMSESEPRKFSMKWRVMVPPCKCFGTLNCVSVRVAEFVTMGTSIEADAPMGVGTAALTVWRSALMLRTSPAVPLQTYICRECCSGG